MQHIQGSKSLNLQQKKGSEDQNLQQRRPEDQNLQQSEKTNLQQKIGSKNQNLQQKSDPDDQNLQQKRGSRRRVANRPPPVPDQGKINLIETRMIKHEMTKRNPDCDRKINFNSRKRKRGYPVFSKNDCGRSGTEVDLCCGGDSVEN